MRDHPAYTLIELLAVIGLIVVIGGFSIISFIGVKNRQAIATSADEIKSVIDRAHIYAREGKDNKSWGIKKKDDNEYYLITGSKSSFSISREFELEQPTVFKGGNFEVWFDLGTGETVAGKSIQLSTKSGKDIEIKISKTGLTQIKNL